MEDNVEEFLEHMGVKGMRWGVRKKIYGEAGGTDRSRKQRVAIEGIGGVAGAVTAYKLAGRSGKFVVPVAVGSAVAVGGAMVARKLIDKHGHKSLNDVLETKPAGKGDKNFDPSKPMSDAEVNKKLKQFYQANPHLGVDASNF